MEKAVREYKCERHESEAKIFLSPHFLDVYEYTVDWIRTGNFAVALSKPWLLRGDIFLESIMCKPVRMRVFCPQVTLNEHGNARVCFLSAFSGEKCVLKWFLQTKPGVM